MFNRLLSSPLLRVPLRYGSIAGVISTGYVISLFYMGSSTFMINPFLDFRVPLFAVLLFFCLKEVRDYYQEGMLYFWQGTAGSLVFLTLSAAVAAIGIYLFGTWQPAFLADYITTFTRQIKDLPAETVERIGKEVVAANLKALPATTVGNLAGLYAWQSYVIGFFISVIISVILRRQPKTQ